MNWYELSKNQRNKQDSYLDSTPHLAIMAGLDRERSAAQLRKEAGRFIDWIGPGIGIGIILVLMGSGIQNAARKAGVPQEELEEALNDPFEVDAAKQKINEYKQMDESTPASEVSEQEDERVDPLEAQRINIIARTIMREGESESSIGKRAIASAVFNRSDGSSEDVVRLIKIPSQFSAWNKATSEDWANMKQYDGSEWAESMAIATEISDGTFSPTTSENHYYNPQTANPYWAYLDKSKTRLRPYKEIGNHRFMTLDAWVGKR